MRTSPHVCDRRPTPELRVAQPPAFWVLVAACAALPAASFRVLALLMTADSTCMNPCRPPPRSSIAVKRIFEPLPSWTRSRFGTSNVETADPGVTTLLAPVAAASSYQILIAPETLTDDWALATAGSAKATVTASIFFFKESYPCCIIQEKKTGVSR